MPPPPQTPNKKKSHKPTRNNSSSVVMVPDFKMNWSTPTKATVLPQGTSWEDFGRQKLPQWSETEKKKFPTAYREKRDSWNLKTSNLASNFLCTFFLSLFDDESKPIPTDSIMKYPTTTKAPESARWYDPSSARCAGCSSRASPPCFLRLVKEYYWRSQPMLSWWLRFTIQGNPRLEMDCPLGNLLGFSQTTDWHWMKLWLENNICRSSNSSVVFEVLENYMQVKWEVMNFFCSSFRVSGFHKLLFQVSEILHWFLRSKKKTAF